MLKVAIVGRPNVGKSTLFNKLSTKKKTIVHNLPGVTRDITLSEGRIADLYFQIIDSAGLFDSPKDVFDKEIYQHTIHSVKQADLLLFTVDCHVGLTDADNIVAKTIRKLDKPTIVVVNKCDGKGYRNNVEDFAKLGFEKIVHISAEHKAGFVELYEVISEQKASILKEENGDSLPGSQNAKNNIIKLVVSGKPNTGKSTLINKIIGQKRLLTADFAGTTRDSVATKWTYKNHEFELVDTAGLRRKRKIEKDSIEQYSNSQTIASVNMANIVVLLNDVNEPLQKQDLKIANLAVNEGKPIILAYNKTDIFKNLDNIREKLNRYSHEVIHNIKNIPIIYLSALKDRNFNYLLDVAIKLYEKWNGQISKKDLNAWLEYATELHPPPLSKSGRRINLKYVTQVAARPPTFKIFANISEDIPKSYIKYLTTSLQKSFELDDIPIRIILQKNHNPYFKKK